MSGTGTGKIKNAVLLDKLLDQWELDATTNKGILNYFQTIVGLLPTAAAPAPAPAPTPTAFAAPTAAAPAPTLNNIQDKIKKLYLVFHYPQYTAGTTPTVFDSKDTTNTKPSILDTHGIFNYVLPEPIAGFTGKRLLSSAGIPKKDMINLKMVIDKIATTAAESDVIKLLFTDESDDIISALTMGGNNSTDIIIPKNTGGKNNRSNKRIKKLRKRNKSSKSMK